MSYDVWVYINSGANARLTQEIGNMTSNVGKMYHLAMPWREGMPGRYNGDGEPEAGRGGLTGLSGMKCVDAAKILQEGLAYMESHPDEMMEVEEWCNGWGSYDGAMKFLSRCFDVCMEHPNATFAVNW